MKDTVAELREALDVTRTEFREDAFAILYWAAQRWLGVLEGTHQKKVKRVLASMLGADKPENLDSFISLVDVAYKDVVLALIPPDHVAES